MIGIDGTTGAMPGEYGEPAQYARMMDRARLLLEASQRESKEEATERTHGTARPAGSLALENCADIDPRPIGHLLQEPAETKRDYLVDL